MSMRNMKLEAHLGLYCSPGYELSNYHLCTVFFVADMLLFFSSTCWV